MRDLTNWPRLIVSGETVTPAQANQILIRTCDIHSSTTSNDPEWNNRVCEAFGIPNLDWEELHRMGPGDRPRNMLYRRARIRLVSQSLGVMRLHFLRNSRISSTWIGGAHGWCDWQGTIACNTWNIGPSPTIAELIYDWETIADAFPYLTLDAQAVTDGGEGHVAAQWHVANGNAKMVTPGPLLTEPSDDLSMPDDPLSSDHERGVTYERLIEAIAQVRSQAGSATVNE